MVGAVLLVDEAVMLDVELDVYVCTQPGTVDVPELP